MYEHAISSKIRAEKRQRNRWSELNRLPTNVAILVQDFDLFICCRFYRIPCKVGGQT